MASSVHLMGQMEPLVIGEHDHRAHGQFLAETYLLQIPHVGLDGIQRGTVHLASGGAQADPAHEGIGGEAEHEYVVGLGQMTVVVDPILDYPGPVSGPARFDAHARPFRSWSITARIAMIARSRSATRW